MMTHFKAILFILFAGLLISCGGDHKVKDKRKKRADHSFSLQKAQQILEDINHRDEVVDAKYNEILKLFFETWLLARKEDQKREAAQKLKDRIALLNEHLLSKEWNPEICDRIKELNEHINLTIRESEDEETPAVEQDDVLADEIRCLGDISSATSSSMLMEGSATSTLPVSTSTPAMATSTSALQEPSINISASARVSISIQDSEEEK